MALLGEKVGRKFLSVFFGLKLFPWVCIRVLRNAL